MQVPVQANLTPAQLESLATTFVRTGVTRTTRKRAKDIDAHFRNLEEEFTGQRALALYHAIVVVHLRRGVDVPDWRESFLDLWARQEAVLLRCLNLRWLISAADTFADFGTTELDRSAGMTAALAANLLKLAETERRAHGTACTSALRMLEGQMLFDGMTAYKMRGGDMVSNLLSRTDRVFGDASPATRLLAEVIERLKANDTVLRRLSGVVETRKWNWMTFGRKVAIFNDTSHSAHFGCELVMHSLHALLASRRCEIIYRHKVGDDLRHDPRARKAIAAADIVLVNGEGSIHSSRDKGRQLAGIGPLARSLGTPCHLINATIAGNDSDIHADIAQFDSVWVRESRSCEELAAHGIESSICPDLTLRHQFAEPEPGAGPTRPLLVVDSVRGAANKYLLALAAETSAPLVTMKRNTDTGRIDLAVPKAHGAWLPKPFGRRAPRGTDLHCTDRDAFAALLRDHRQVITGRFHGVCFALALGVPFHAVASNTFKIEALVEDVGLDPARMLPEGARRPAVLPYSDAERLAIAAYLDRARSAADIMLHRVLG